ncbi:hypothetical protein EV359DRAFT_86869 [Lentinula novae-zelandiae]|nr:hypothetical protein EV359DRAFT_86869 [Lentinula novae-zelandiae]
MSATLLDRPSSSKIESKKQKGASSPAITVAADQHPPLTSSPEQSLGDETSSKVKTLEGCQPMVREPPPVDLGATGMMGPPQQRYASMGYAQPASSLMEGFNYSPTWKTRGPPPGPVPQLDMKSALNVGGRVSSQVAVIEKQQEEEVASFTSHQKDKLPEREVSPTPSEQSRTSSGRLLTPPAQSLNLPQR